MDKLRVFTAFSEYDSQCMALDRLGIDYELVGWSEIDKYAIQAHNAIYPQWAERNYGDISKIDWTQVPDFDLFTYSSPCQDFSIAGQQKGGEEGSGTRSSLLWECRKAIIAKKPKYLFMENVKNLVGKKHLRLFQRWEEELSSYGYSNYAKVMDTQDYGVPQHRERLYMISIMGDEVYTFPEPIELKYKMEGILEENVDEKYFLKKNTLNCFIRTNNDTSHCHKFIPKNPDDVAFTIRTKAGQRVDDNYIKVRTEPLNPMPDGNCRTIKSQYYKTGKANFSRVGSMGATGVVQYLSNESEDTTSNG